MVANLSNEKPSLQTVQMFDNGSDNYKDWTINYQAVSETSLTFVEAYFTTLNGATIYRDTDFDGVLEYHSGGDTLGNYRLQRFTLVEEDGSYDDIYNIPSDVDANVFEQFADLNWSDNNVLGGFPGSDDFIPPSLLSFEVFDLISDADQLLINYKADDQSGLSLAHASFVNQSGDTLFFSDIEDKGVMEIASGDIIAGQTYHLQTVVLVDGSNNYTWSEFYPNGNTDAHVNFVPLNTADLSGVKISIAEEFTNLSNSVPTFSYPGGPLLAGVLAPHETISVYLHDLVDEDGITNATFEYQWFADDTEIEGAVNSGYTITDQDVGKKIGIKITYQDDGGFTNTVLQKLYETVVGESVSVFEVPILRYGATNGVPYFIGVETAKLRVRDDDSFAYVYDADYGAKVSSLGGMAVEYDGYVIPNFILEDRGISRSLTSDNRYFDAAYLHIDGVIPSIPETVVNGVSSLLIPLGASSDFLSLGLDSGEESYTQFVSKIIQEIGVPDSEPYGPGKTNWLKQVASDLQSQWRAISQEDQTIVGTDADDNLLGGFGDDTITGGGGNDTLNGGAGNDTLDGGEGDDEIYGGEGDDIIYTSAGNDIYDGGAGIDTVITDYVNTPPTLGGSISLRNIENQFFIGETNITIDRSLDPESGNNHVKSQSGDDRIWLGVGDDTFELGAGKNYSGGGDGNDTIILSSDNKFTSSYVAKNISSSLQIGTEERINLNGKTRFEDVMDGGADVDTVELTDASDAFFLHDSFSGFHSSLELTDDYAGKSGTARIENIETINAGGGDDIIDLTSPDYSLAGQNITVDGGDGNDTLWGSDANETLKGGNGGDVLFGGAGTNTLTGGAGADEFQFTRTSIAETVTDYDLGSGDQLTFFYEAGSEEADWNFSIQNGDLRWGENTIDFGTMELRALDELSIFVEQIGSGQATQFEYVPTLGEEILRLDLYPSLYEQDYYSKIVSDLQFAEFNDLAPAIEADMTFLGGLNEVAEATGLQANGNGFTYSAGAFYNNTYNTVEISADILNFKIDGIAANPISLQALLDFTTPAPGKVGGLFNSITLSANSVDYLTLKHSANGLSLVYDNATNGMINELRLDGNFNNDLNAVIPVVSDLLNFDFSDPIALIGSQEFLNTSANLDGLATLTGLSILQKGVADPYLQLIATDTTLNVAYKDWNIVGAIEVSETWQPDPDAFLTALQNLVTDSNDLDLSELGSLYQGAGSLSLSIIHDDAGKLAEGIIHDFGDLVGSLDRGAGDEFIFGTAVGESYAIDSNGLAAVVFKEREFNEAQTVELLETLGLKEKQLKGTVISSSGAVEGVTVFVDRNNNYSIDLEEEVAVTDASGIYVLYLDNPDIADDTVVALPQNVGSYTSQLSPLTLEAPSNSSIITQLTTLSVRSDKTTEEILDHLNIQSDIDVLTFNAFADGVDSVSATEVIDSLKTIETATGIALATSQAMGLPLVPDYSMIENIVFSDSIIG